MSPPAHIATFSVADYVVFSGTLVMSLAIGVYHAVKGNKTTDDFLLASRSMSPVPVALSLTATMVSSISILGYVGEVYGHGLQMCWFIVGMVISMTVATTVVLPVFYPLRLSSINEYVELRFGSRTLRRLVLLLSSISMLLYLGICLYAPSLALESVTPLSSTAYILMLGVVVTVYSSIGGLKAVVWTDAVQAVVVVAGVAVAWVSATVDGGGWTAVWTIAHKHGRTEVLDFSFGLYTRHTVVNTVLMGFFAWLYMYGFTQSILQRVATMPNMRAAKLVMCYCTVGMFFVVVMMFLSGVSIFAVYAGCDPITLGYVTRQDQLLPYYVMDHLGFLTGVPGLFVACLFSGTLSSISSILNSLPTMLWVEELSSMPFFQRTSETARTIANKAITGFLGVVMMCLAMAASQLGGIIEAALTVLSVFAGPITGVFVLGIAAPGVSKRGVIVGFVVSIVAMVCLGIGAQLYGEETVMLPLYTNECHQDTTAANSTNWLTTFAPPTTTAVSSAPRPMSVFYNISYTLFATIGFFLCVIISLLVTLCTGRDNLEDINPAHVLHCLRKYVGPKPSLLQPEQTLFLKDLPPPGNASNTHKSTDFTTAPGTQQNTENIHLTANLNENGTEQTSFTSNYKPNNCEQSPQDTVTRPSHLYPSLGE